MTKISKAPKLTIKAAALLMSLLSVQSITQVEDKCLAIAFSSGAESAAFQAGALYGLTQKMKGEDVRYSAVSGVSGGALNAILLAQTKIGLESYAAMRMMNFWEAASMTELYEKWWGGIATGLLVAGGLYDSYPLKQFLATQITTTDFERMLNFGIVDVLEGKYVDFTDQNITSVDALVNASYASFAYPGFFPPVKSFNASYYDGAAVYDMDVFSPINDCIAKGYNQSDIIVDVILSSQVGLTEIDGKSLKSINMLFRYLEISSYYKSMDGLLRAMFAYPDVKFRHVVSPTVDLSSSRFPMNLTQSQIVEIIQQGVADAEAVVESSSSSSSLEDTLHFYHLTKSNNKKVKGMNFGQFIKAKKEGNFEKFEAEKEPSFIKYKVQSNLAQ